MNPKERGESFRAYAYLVLAMAGLFGAWALVGWLVAGGPLWRVVQYSNWRTSFPDLIVGLTGAFAIGIVLWRIQSAAALKGRR